MRATSWLRAIACAVGAAFVVACGASKPRAPAPSAVPSSVAAETALSPRDRAIRALTWNDFPGPMTEPASVGPIAWVVAPPPSSDWTANLAVFRAEVQKAPRGGLVFERSEGWVHVPGVFTRAPTIASYRKGQPVIVGERIGMVAGAIYGRVEHVVQEGGATRYAVKILVGAEMRRVVVGPDALLPLDDTLAMGAPAAYRDGGAWREVVYVGQGLDERSAWVLQFANKAEQRPVPTPLAINRVYKKGEKVWAAQYSTLEPAVVLEVIEGGLLYRLRIAGSYDETLGFDRVTAPL